MSKKDRKTEIKDGTYLKLYSLNPESDQVFYNTNKVKHSVEDGMTIIRTNGREFKISSLLLEKPGIKIDENLEYNLGKMLLTWWYNKSQVLITEEDISIKGSDYLTKDDFPLFGKPFYKYVPIEIYKKFIETGIWQIGTLGQYQKIENENQRDPLEGFANLRMRYNDQGLSMICAGTSNHYLFCGTDKDNSQYHREKFGLVKIAINNPYEFAKEIAKSINAQEFEIRKVKYHPIKLFKFLENIKPSSSEKQPEMDHNFLTKLAPVIRLPSLYVKIPRFEPESEIRIAFQVKKDPLKPLKIQNTKLNRFISVELE